MDDPVPERVDGKLWNPEQMIGLHSLISILAQTLGMCSKVIPKEVLPGQVAMVLLVQTREPRIQTFNLTNSIYQGFLFIVSLVIFVCFDGQEDNKVKLWSDFTSVLTAFWSEA